MKSGAISALVLIGVVLFAAIYWMEININPVISLPPPPTPPAHNAYDDFVAARTLERDGDKCLYAAMAWPRPYRDPTDPDDREYSLAEKTTLLAENQPMLAKIREGLALPFVSRDKPFFSFKGHSAFREEARLLNFAGVVNAKEGNWNDAIRCDLDTVQLGAKISQNGGIIDRLVDIACEAIGRRHAWDAIDHLPGAQAKSAAQRLESIQASQCPPTMTVENDKWMNLAFLDRGFHAKGIGGTVLSFAPVISMGSGKTSIRDYLTALGTSKRAVVAGYSGYMDRFAERCRYSYGVARSMPPISLPANPVSQAITPELDKFVFKDAENVADNDLLIVALALQAYKDDHGVYPDSLAQLAPAYLNSVPADPFAVAGPLRYRKTATKYVLYSVGPDGKDDGGKPAVSTGYMGRKNYYVTKDSRGDMVAGVNN